MKEIDIRVIVADDHNLVRGGIVSLLESVKGMYVVAEAENGRDLYEKYFEVKPDVILTDISMPIMTGLEAVRKIQRKEKSAKALFLSMYEGDEYVAQVLAVGGRGLISKSILKGELVFAIKAVFKGGHYFGGQYNAEKLKEIKERYNEPAKRDIDKYTYISERELEVLRLICEGLNTEEISQKLNLARKTIDYYRGSLLKKCSVTSSTQLIKYAITNRLV